MARPHKKGIEYFPFDVNFFTFDTKIKILRARYGSDGIVVYIYLLAEIYKDEGYYLKVDDDFNYVISEELNMSAEKIGQIMNFLLERSLFDNTLFKSDKVLTSRGIQRRFQEAVAKRTAIEIDSKYWLLEENETKSFIKCTQNQGFYGENGDNFSENEGFRGKNDTKESKVKKSKEDIKHVVEVVDADASDDNDDCDRLQIYKRHVLLSENQIIDLLERMGLEAFDTYLEKLDNFIHDKNANVKSCYETMLKWYDQDRTIKGKRGKYGP